MENIENLDSDFQPLKKKRKKADPATKKRFGSPLKADTMKVFSKGHVPLNTQKNTDWSMKIFKEWLHYRNKRTTGEERRCPEDLLDNPDTENLNYWISRFVAEVRNKKGDPYPPRTVHSVLSGLQRFMLDKNPTAPKFLNKSESSFRDIRGTCDTVYRDLHSKGIGTSVHHTPIITQKEEDALWLSNVLSIDTPKSLQRAVFFYVGKCFCIRGGQEQRNLGPSNFKWDAQPGCDPHCVTYTEHGSKNRSGGIEQLRIENKEVPCYSVPDNNPVCLVFLLNLYFKRLPKYAFEKDILYLRPKASTPVDPSTPWYEDAAVGKNTLSSMVKDMCGEAGIDKKTNHSLRASGASAMFRANVPEKIIQKTTGHRSLEALRSYERVSAEQHKAVAKVLMTNASYKGAEVEFEPHPEQTGTGGNLSRLFGGLGNCSIGNITVNINPTLTQFQSQVENQFDELVRDVNFDF